MQHTRIETLSLRDAIVTVGVFDGVHRGHQQLITKLVEQARAHGKPSVVITFDPHPAAVFSAKEIKLLTTPDERAEILSSLGVDHVITQRFTPELAQVSAHEYMSTLKQHLGISRLLLGYDSKLGKNREGDASRLTEIGRELGYTVETTPALQDHEGVISSTLIRNLIAAGDVTRAADLMARPHVMSGEVIHGEGRGKSINYPTANIDYPKQKIMPKMGIYACRARLASETFMAAVNIGLNPTFTPERQTASLEAYLLEFDRDIYGQTLTLEFIARIRDELKFTSVEALVKKIDEDVEKTRGILSAMQ